MKKRMIGGGSIVSAIYGLIREIAQERLTCEVPEMKCRSALNKRVSSGIFSDNNAVSTVIGAILLLGLIVSCVAFVEVHYVPSWGADDEARHVRDVFVDFSTVPDRIDTLVLANDTDIVSKQRIKLGIGDMPLTAPGKSWGTIGAVPREGNFTVEADVWMVNITEKNANGSITVEGVNITNISSVSLFYIYIDHDRCHQGWDGEIFVNFTNQSGGVKLELVTKCKKHLKISTWNSDGDKIVDEIYIDRDVVRRCSRYYRVDLLNPSYGFNKVLSDADTPYNLTITITTTVSEACSYAIIYNEHNKSLEHYSITSNGTLIYESMNRYFLDQKFIYQNGAVFLCQPPDASMRIAPAITIENTTNESARITIPMVTVVASEGRIPMISGSDVEELQLELDHVCRTSFADGNNTNAVNITIDAPEGDKNFRRSYLQEWADYFDEIVDRTPVHMPKIDDFDNNNTSVNITLNGSIHLEIRDIEIDGRVTSI